MHVQSCAYNFATVHLDGYLLSPPFAFAFSCHVSTHSFYPFGKSSSAKRTSRSQRYVTSSAILHPLELPPRPLHRRPPIAVLPAVAVRTPSAAVERWRKCREHAVRPWFNWFQPAVKPSSSKFGWFKGLPSKRQGAIFFYRFLRFFPPTISERCVYTCIQMKRFGLHGLQLRLVGVAAWSKHDEWSIAVGLNDMYHPFVARLNQSGIS